MSFRTNTKKIFNEYLFKKNEGIGWTAAIPLLKGIHERLSLPSLRYETMGAGYDYEPIYNQIHQMGHQAVTAYNKRNEPEPIGFDKHFAPTCVREHSYRYDCYFYK
ncbi:hypothetical protein J2Y67_000849 [Neobacillus niacini]|nr:hypothetical protein [Neobacillus niacini]